MHITVGVCTWNRADLLRQVLDSLCRLTVPSDVTWELLVVNNRCTDRTDDVLADFIGRLPLRRLFESEQGVSAARNLVVQQAAGELLLWLDDDEFVSPSWLAEYAEAARLHPEATFFGGMILPQFEVDPPPWLRAVYEQVADVFGHKDGPPEPRKFDLIFQPFGGNSAVRTKILRAFGYSSRLGRNGGQLLGCEETALFRQLLAAGHAGWWVPRAIVRHFVPRTRMSLAYIRAYMAGKGRTQVRLFPRMLAPTRAERNRMWWRALRLECGYQIGRWFLAPSRWIALLVEASTRRGEWLELESQSRTGATFIPKTANVLGPGEMLRAGESRTSPNGCRLEMQADGNLVLYQGTQALWATDTNGVKDACCILQDDGNLVVYARRGRRHQAVWASNTRQDSLSWVELVVKDDGNLVLYQNGRAIWDFKMTPTSEKRIVSV